MLVIGAAGGVGSFGVQIARAFGAHVTGVCSTSKVELVRSIGADEVIDYTREDIADGTRRYDVIFDTAGNRDVSSLRRALSRSERSYSPAAKAEDGGSGWVAWCGRRRSRR